MRLSKKEDPDEKNKRKLIGMLGKNVDEGTKERISEEYNSRVERLEGTLKFPSQAGSKVYYQMREDLL
jgi:hypothetical protein